MTTASIRLAPSRARSFPALATSLALLASVALASPAAAADKPYRFDLYRKGDFVSQTTVYMCVGASMQMMLNMIEPTDNRTAARQKELWELARSFRRTNDPTQMNSGSINHTRRGASSRGWAAGLTVLGAGPYHVTARPTLKEAANVAARQIRLTGQPVGLLVWRGAHAWVVSGFEATGDPLYDPRAEVTHLYILDPYYPRVSKLWGPSAAPHTKMSLAKLGEDWVQWRRSANRPGLTGRWAMILPYVQQDPAARRSNLR
ncbi:MAG TPA: hypothetical protein VGQ58_08230 [Candidatus Limnocylindrales bacterium]|nr:hypothetical protein [Candidatus Limnocylindrales bacterium]